MTKPTKPQKLEKSAALNLYYQMSRIRRVEERIAKEYAHQEIRCPVHLCIGEEAIASGTCQNLSLSDAVMSNHRSHGHYLAKGGHLPQMIAEIYGKKTGCSLGRGGSQHLIDLQVNFLGSTPVVGGIIPVATGVAWAMKLKQQKSVVVVFLGDAAVEQGVFHESLNFAALYKLPILYVCENNFYSILTPLSVRQPQREIFALAQAHGITTFQADGNDVLTVDEVTKQALSKIKAGNGPVFIEYHTYRLKEHCGHLDEPPGWRPEAEYRFWVNKDPITSYKKYLVDQKLTTIAALVEIEDKIEKEIDQAFIFAANSPYLVEVPYETRAFKT
jgi:pyruvate dehydrogenase E1 component alpha subunit